MYFIFLKLNRQISLGRQIYSEYIEATVTAGCKVKAALNWVGLVPRNSQLLNSIGEVSPPSSEAALTLIVLIPFSILLCKNVLGHMWETRKLILLQRHHADTSGYTASLWYCPFQMTFSEMVGYLTIGYTFLILKNSFRSHTRCGPLVCTDWLFCLNFLVLRHRVEWLQRACLLRWSKCTS